LKYTDSTGHFLDWIIDIASIVFDIGQLAAEPSWENGGYLAADVILWVVPFVPAGAGPVAKTVKTVAKTVKGADKVTEGAKAIRASQDELTIIKYHLKRPQFSHGIENDVMIERINSKIEKGENLTRADANFYNHELFENELMNSGMKYEDAHSAALEKYNMCEWDLYDPSSVKAADEATGGWRTFNDDYYNYWGIE
jgi:hypothetical protein